MYRLRLVFLHRVKVRLRGLSQSYNNIISVFHSPVLFGICCYFYSITTIRLQKVEWKLQLKRINR